LIRDIDVSSLYPSIAIVNRLYPEHLGEAFISEYSKIPVERSEHAKGTVENASLKLAANGTYGNSNNKYSVFYDPKFTMTITINGQLMLCMLAERLAKVPTIKLIQINTDGITYKIHKDHLDAAKAIEDEWSRFTCLTLEVDYYSKLFIRDVNNYVAEYSYPKVHNKYHRDAPENAVYCGRGSKYGNPFKDGTRDENCDNFEKYILPKLNVSDLKGKPLICFCSPKRCHCDSIIKKANGPRKLKQKGAYWFPDPQNYAESISNNSPPAWHKDLGNVISQRAALNAMLYGIDPEIYIRTHTDPYDFMLRAKVDRSSKLMLGDKKIQSTSRYYVAVQGAPLVKVSPPAKGNIVGTFKRASKIPEDVWKSVNASIPAGAWDARIHTKNKSKYTIRHTNLQAGWKCAECNDVRDFDFSNVDYDFYVKEAKKLIIL